ncbi:MFS transporter [Caulobacter sp. BP25]|uniref:MFS transporter n=1 Tax=Caulobacter sp. BP25 TaxID=2048900 RepID=UPI000C12C66F|nr:MFS transporter [Caulobacter sp. BP25]PHY18805.1 MFS transporter [Caulobacter sp. BP25]
MVASVSNASNEARGYEWRIIVASSLGNALEWFDFIIFGFLAATMAELFFPAGDRNTSLLLTFATFGVTFLLRPLGAMLLGSYADRRGRKDALVLCIGLMTAGSAIIGLAPTYEVIGIGAPLLVLLARSLQGLSAGGEFGATLAFMAEQSGRRRGYLASWPLASQGLTTILAAGCGAALARGFSPEDLKAWGWRIPFLIGVAIGPIAFYIRARLVETPAFRSMAPAQAPVRSLMTSGKLGVALCAGLMAAPAVMVYVLLYLPVYATTQLGLRAPDAFLGAMVAGAEQLLLIPILGRLSDRYGGGIFMLCGAVLMLAIAYPLFAWIAFKATAAALMLAQTTIGLVSSIYLGPLGGVIAKRFPPQTRTSGMALGHAIGVTSFGGLAPLIFTLLIATTGDKLSPSIFVAVAAGVSLACVMVVRRDDARREATA